MKLRTCPNLGMSCQAFKILSDFFRVTLAMVIGFAACTGANSETAVEVDFHPFLETGGHMGLVRSVAFSADGKVLVSASDDKTLRVWDVNSGGLLRVLRGQIGRGYEGMNFSVAVSQNGEMVAVGGYYNSHLSTEPPFGDVRIFESDSGKLVRVLKGFEYVVSALSYDSDSDVLAIGGQGGVVQRWAGPFGDEVPHRLPDFDSDANRVVDLIHAEKGKRLIAATSDYGLRIWETSSGSEIAFEGSEALFDAELIDISASSDGKVFALSGRQGLVELRNAVDGSLLQVLPNQDFGPGALAFAENDKILTFSCRYDCLGQHQSFLWNLDEARLVGQFQDRGALVMDAVATPDGKLIASAMGPNGEIKLWNVRDQTLAFTMRGIGEPVHAVGISENGTEIAWGRIDPCPTESLCPNLLGALQTTLELPSQDRNFEKPRRFHTDASGFERAVLTTENWQVQISPQPWQQFLGEVVEITSEKEPLQIQKRPSEGYTHRALTLLKNAGHLISGGGNGVILSYDADTGDFEGEFIGHAGAVSAVAATEAGNRLISGSHDQTLKIWNLKERTLIASLFEAGEDWIIWTPQGYYHSSPNGDRLIGWHINQGQDVEARFVQARQLRKHLHSPEIVRRALVLGDAAAAARELRGSDRELQELLRQKPPEFQIRIAESVQVQSGHIAIEVLGSNFETAAEWQFSLLINNRRVPLSQVRSFMESGRLLYEVPVKPGENSILIAAKDDHGFVTERGVVSLSDAKIVEKKGKLFVAVMGVNDYPNLPEECAGAPCNLSYPVADAIEFLSVVSDRIAPLYEDMDVLAMVNRERFASNPEWRERLQGVVTLADIIEPNSDNVTDKLIDFLSQPGPDDTTIVFIAGHGVNIGENYFFLPTDAQKRSDRWRKSSLVDWQVIQEEIGFSVGRRILMIDTCHAANAYNAKLEKEAADARVIVFSATASNNTAAERADLGHGIFTHALLEGLRGRADPSGDGVRLLGLADYVYREVIRLSDKRQQPYYHISQTENFQVTTP